MLTAVEYRATPLTRVSQRSTISWLVHTQRASFPLRLELEIVDMFAILSTCDPHIPASLSLSDHLLVYSLSYLHEHRDACVE